MVLELDANFYSWFYGRSTSGLLKGFVQQDM
jgi:hypothetical protein